MVRHGTLTQAALALLENLQGEGNPSLVASSLFGNERSQQSQNSSVCCCVEVNPGLSCPVSRLPGTSPASSASPPPLTPFPLEGV